VAAGSNDPGIDHLPACDRTFLLEVADANDQGGPQFLSRLSARAR
jgi:hypothetical protein